MPYFDSTDKALSWIGSLGRYGHSYPSPDHRLVACAEIKPLNGWRRVRVYCACGSMWNTGFALPPDYQSASESGWIGREAEDAVAWHAAHIGDPIYRCRWTDPASAKPKANAAG